MPDPIVTPPAAPPEPVSPYAAYGVDAQGNIIIPKPAAPSTGPGVDPKVAALETKLATLETSLQNVTGMSETMKVIDKVIKSISGEGEKTDPAQYKSIFEDLKKISPPGVRKALEILERDPDALDRLAGQVGTLEGQALAGVNVTGHNHVLDLAKKAGITKGMNASEAAKAVYPFERAITEVINSNPKLRDAYVSGNVDVIDEVFNNLVGPYVAQRVREKQARSARSNVTVAPPGGKATPNATSDANKGQGRDLSTPKGRAAFHKAAVNRFFDKAAGDDE